MKEKLYLTIYEKLREQIISGAYKYGEKLPSKRNLALEYGVSVITAEHVYDLLLSEGYAEAREKSGYFCIFNKDDRFLSSPSFDYAPEKTSALSNSDEFSFSIYSKTVRRVLSVYGETVLSRVENGGAPILKNAIARYLGRGRSIKIDEDQIVIGAGAEYLYGLIVDTLGRNRIYAVEDPSYEQIERVYRAKGVKCRLLPLKKDGIESTALKNTDASVLHITPYRSFPSGVTASVSKRHEYLRWAKEKDRIIVEDDFESEFTVNGKTADTVFSMSDNANVIYINTFSKTVSSGIRVAFMALPKKFVPVFKKNAGFYSCTVPALEQYVLAELLNGGDFERHINRVRRRLRKEIKNEK